MSLLGAPEPAHGLIHRTLVRTRNLGVVQGALRARARRRIGKLEPGSATVVITSWNSEQFLEVCLSAVRRFADRPTTILVIDNHSKRSPHDTARRHGARFVRLPVNAGHSFALDIGFLTAKTEYAIALDVDAFPYGGDWMPTLLGPLSNGINVVGPEWNGYAHPCNLAMRTAHFVERGYSFAADLQRGWDVGESITRQEGDKALTLPKLGNLLGEHMVGATYAGSIYHNAYSTRHLRLPDPETAILDGDIKRSAALQAWDEAMRRYGPSTWDSPRGEMS